MLVATLTAEDAFDLARANALVVMWKLQAMRHASAGLRAVPVMGAHFWALAGGDAPQQRPLTRAEYAFLRGLEGDPRFRLGRRGEHGMEQGKPRGQALFEVRQKHRERMDLVLLSADGAYKFDTFQANGTVCRTNMATNTAFRSFVGAYPIPARHGMTVGEMARMLNTEFGINARLTVVPLHGWRRELFGEAALALKHGRLALAIEKGRVIRVDRA